MSTIPDDAMTDDAISDDAMPDALAGWGEAARVRRLPVLDEYVEDGRSAVLLPGQVLTLSQVATAVLAHLGEEWSSMQDLATSVEAEVGAPEDGSTAEALAQVLADLAGHELVERQLAEPQLVEPQLVEPS